MDLLPRYAAVLMVSLPAAAIAGLVSEIRCNERINAGLKFYQEKNCRAALVEFEGAYRECGKPGLLYNIGSTYQCIGEQTGCSDLRVAASYLRQFVANVEKNPGEFSDSITAKARKDAPAKIAQIESRCPSLQLKRPVAPLVLTTAGGVLAVAGIALTSYGQVLVRSDPATFPEVGEFKATTDRGEVIRTIGFVGLAVGVVAAVFGGSMFLLLRPRHGDNPKRRWSLLPSSGGFIIGTEF